MISALIYLVVNVLVLGLTLWLILWVLDQFPVPEPFNRVIRVVLTVVAVILVILLLLRFAGLVDLPPPGAIIPKQ